MPTRLEIKQIRSRAGKTEHQRKILTALGLRKREQVVVHEDSPRIRGMIRMVAHLVDVREKTEG